MANPEPTVRLEPFSAAVRACRDILVDDVSRHVGVPIIGDPTPLSTIDVGDVAAARDCLAAAITADRTAGLTLLCNPPADTSNSRSENTSPGSPACSTRRPAQ